MPCRIINEKYLFFINTVLLLIFWSGFALAISCLDNFNQSHYLFASILMLCMIYSIHFFYNFQSSLSLIIFLLNIPISLLWYVAFVYNDFLALAPISYELFMSFFFLYSYTVLYFFVVLRHNKYYN